MSIYKKIALSLGAIVLAVTLVACGKTSPDKNIVTMKGHTITITDLFNQEKVYPNTGANTVLTNMTISYILNKELGSQVTDKNVQDEYDKEKQQYGDSFASVLNSQGLNDQSLRETIRQNLLQKAAVDKEVAATQYTDANLKAMWENYHPEVDTYIVANNTQDAANQAHDMAVNNTDTFKSQANDNNLEVKFDSSNATIPQEVQDAAFKLQNGQTSDVISVTKNSTTTYYFVYMIKAQDKGADMSKYTSQLKNAIKVQKENDTDFNNNVIKTYLKKYNVLVKDTDFAGIFNQFMGTTDTSSASQ